MTFETPDQTFQRFDFLVLQLFEVRSILVRLNNRYPKLFEVLEPLLLFESRNSQLPLREYYIHE